MKYKIINWFINFIIFAMVIALILVPSKGLVFVFFGVVVIITTILLKAKFIDDFHHNKDE